MSQYNTKNKSFLKMQHNFEFIWEKDSLFTEKYISISEEFLHNTF